MNLTAYLDLYEVLESDTTSRNERRAFGLSHADLKEEPQKQLLVWTEERRRLLPRPTLSETVNAYLYGVTLTIVLLAFLFGFVSGVALLSYNGHEPVNVIYFMAMVITVPLVTMTLTLLSMLRANSKRSMLVHISPSYWLEKIISLLPNRMQGALNHHFSDIKISPLIANWLVIKRSQVVALAFSTGLLLALLAMVATRDIAFAWGTTLSVSPQTFHDFLNTLAFAWRDLFPWAVPSLELVEKSQYYRLGGILPDEMIKIAPLLGEWWKFLFFATLFYALLLRFGMFLIASYGLKRSVSSALLTLEGVSQLLNDMNEPLITTSAKEDENDFVPKDAPYAQLIHKLDASYDVVLGWAMGQEDLKVLNDHMNVIVPKVFEAGGANTLQEDNEIIAQCWGEVLLYVKAWEPPTMDFIDFVEMLLKNVDNVIVIPIGTESQAYLCKEKELNVWARKLSLLNSDKVWLKV